MKNYLINFMTDAKWPSEAVLSLSNTYSDICIKEPINSVFIKWIDTYESENMMTGELYRNMLDEVSSAAEKCNISRYQAELLIFMCLSRGLKKFYAEQDIDEKIFNDSMLDLRCKLYECQKMYGIWGSFVAGWFPGFFYLDRFALGRLQFEPIKAGFDYIDELGRTVNQGDTVLNVHIPSLGKLDYTDVTNSYKKAAEFYKSKFKNGYTVFICHSWLLFPKHREMLSKESHIVRFMDDYHLLHENKQELPGDMWRVYYAEYNEDFTKLPRRTKLQSAYADYLTSGNLPGEGFGVHII